MPPKNTRILVVDSDARIGRIIQDYLKNKDYDLDFAHDGESALRVAQTHHPDYAFLDLHTPGISELDVLTKLKGIDDGTAVIAISSIDDPKMVVKALEKGAEDFIAKPFDPSLIEIAIQNIREKRTLRDQVSRLKNELERDHAFGMLIGETPQIIQVREFVEQVADSDLNILIRGESGTGKDVTARLIHQLSRRRDGPFVKVNCAALPENLIESELFGYEKGAFTGANRAKPGRFQLAHGGTIFLDEITEIPFALQSKLLQVLEQKEFVRVGGTRNQKVDCRCIAATNANMELELKERKFREDLYFRLNEFAVHLPPLRNRKEDIPLLIDYFMSQYCERYGRPRRDITPKTLEAIMDYDWPGNVRELESLMKKLLVMDTEEVVHQHIGLSHINQQPAKTSESKPAGLEAATSNGIPPSFPIMDPLAAINGEQNLKSIVDRAVEETEKRAIRETLQRVRWNRRKAAQTLGISYSSLLRRIEKYNLEAEGSEGST